MALEEKAERLRNQNWLNYVLGFNALIALRQPNITMNSFDAFSADTNTDVSIATVTELAFTNIGIPSRLNSFLLKQLGSNARLIHLEYSTCKDNDEDLGRISFAARAGEKTGRFDIMVPSGQVTTLIEQRGREDITGTTIQDGLIEDLRFVARDLPQTSLVIQPSGKLIEAPTVKFK